MFLPKKLPILSHLILFQFLILQCMQVVAEETAVKQNNNFFDRDYSRSDVLRKC